jgi:hypothetical protein
MLAVKPSEEPIYLGELTPLGQRQQFLIGSEFRARYVDEALFMNPLYTVNQNYLQTVYTSFSVQSMQAMMMGLYPSSDLNTLNEWQQGNAVPPVEGADYT